MTDWLEVARRELAAPDRKEVSSVSAAGGVGTFKKSGAFGLNRQTVHDIEVPFGIPGETLPPVEDEKPGLVA